jgi:UDP-glucose 4-epimerase
MKYLVVGGAGFIGSHTTRTLLENARTELVRVFDNFSSGQESFLVSVRNDPRLQIIRADAAELPPLIEAARGIDTLFHFASNPDIARAVREPTIDFTAGTLLTQNIVEAARVAGVRQFIYASGSGVYGEMENRWYDEEPLTGRPISTYGASKLAGEALLCSYAAMFGLRAYAFRFANVVGPNQTHGVGFDFLRKLKRDPHRLEILGDGTQSKSYIHVSDVVRALLLLHRQDLEGYHVFNVSTDDFLTVAEIAHLSVAVAGLPPDSVEFAYTGGNRGWKGDVPLVRIRSDRLKALGWRAGFTSHSAMKHALDSMANSLVSSDERI